MEEQHGKWNEQYGEEQANSTGEPSSSYAGADEQAKRLTERAKERVVSAGRKAADKINEQREPAARTLDSAASALHEKAENLPGVKKVSNMAHATADRLQATADYVREHDVQAVMTDLGNIVRRHPGESLAAAVIVGFLFGRLFRGNYSA